MCSRMTAHGEVTVGHRASFREAIARMEQAGRGIALIADEKDHLQGVLTSGDIRKALLAGVGLEEPVTRAMNPDPVVVSRELSAAEVYRLMLEQRIRYVPVVEATGRLEGILYETDLRGTRLLTCPALLMAGGLGTRLRPLTDQVPKPLLPLGPKPMIQHIIERLRWYGIRDFFVAVNYKGRMIEEFLQDGRWLRVRIRYLREKKRLGTAGALGLMETNSWKELLVLNADVLTDLDLYAMFQFHLDNANDLTLAVKRFKLQVPYGVVQLDMNRVVGLSEKPSLNNYINAGIYILNRRVLGEVPRDEFFNMTDLINKLVQNSHNVGSYLIKGDWTDVGLPEQYHQINGRLQSLGSPGEVPVSGLA